MPGLHAIQGAQRVWPQLWSQFHAHSSFAFCILHHGFSHRSWGSKKGGSADAQLAKLLQIGSPTLTWSCRIADCLPLVLRSHTDVNVAISTASSLPALRSWNEVPSLASCLSSSADYCLRVS